MKKRIINGRMMNMQLFGPEGETEPDGDPDPLDFLGDDDPDPLAGEFDPPGEGGGGEDGKTVSLDKFNRLLKSYKSQQTHVNKQGESIKGLDKMVKDLKDGNQDQTKKLLAAFGVNPDDDAAKKIIDEYENDKIGFVNKLVDERLAKELPEMKKDISTVNLKSDVKSAMDDISSEYDVEYTPELASKVAVVLKTKFKDEYKNKNRKAALIEATQIATGNELKKRGSDIIFAEPGAGTSASMKKTIIDRAEKIKRGMVKAAGKGNDAFSMKKVNP